MAYYYSIRVIEAESENDALDKVYNQEFYETHDMCDVIITRDQLIEAVAFGKIN